MPAMTWKEFKAAVDKALAEAGKSDEETIIYMDFSYPDAGDFDNGNLEVFVLEDGITIH